MARPKGMDPHPQSIDAGVHATLFAEARSERWPSHMTEVFGCQCSFPKRKTSKYALSARVAIGSQVCLHDVSLRPSFTAFVRALKIVSKHAGP